MRWRAARTWAACITTACALVAAGCTEKLDGSAGCPLTCNESSAVFQTITLDAVAKDTSVLGGLGLGTEQLMLLSNRGDTLDTRVVVRFDTLPGTQVTSATDATQIPIAEVDSATLRLRIDSSAVNLKVPVTISVYDVDDSTVVDDTSASVLQARFTPSRLITTYIVPAGQLVDSLIIPLPTDTVLTHAQARGRLRFGLQVSSTVSVSTRIRSLESAFGPTLVFHTSGDSAVAPVILSPYSLTPANNGPIRNSLSDFTVVVKGTPPPPAGFLAIGGLPGTRAYFLFNIPDSIVDSSLVVRATLLLTQFPSTSPDPADTMSVQPFVLFAAAGISDPSKAAQIVAPQTSYPFLALQVLPGSAGVREVEISPAFGVWPLQNESDLPRAIVIESSQEDYSPQQTLFYSSKAADPTLRPKLRISYTPRARIGVP